MTDLVERPEFAPCPTCRQYSHSIPEDQVAKAFRHFHAMIGHPLRGTPMGDVFDAETQDAAQVMTAELNRLRTENEAMATALETIAKGSRLGLEMFGERMRGKRSLTWWAVNVLQDNLEACMGTAARSYSPSRSEPVT